MRLFSKLAWNDIGYSMGLQFVVIMLGILYKSEYIEVFMVTYFIQFMFTGTTNALQATSNIWGVAEERLGHSIDTRSRRLTCEALTLMIHTIIFITLLATMNQWGEFFRLKESHMEAAPALIATIFVVNNSYSSTTNMCYEGKEKEACRIILIINIIILAIVPIVKLLGFEANQAIMTLTLVSLTIIVVFKIKRLLIDNKNWKINLPGKSSIKFILPNCFGDICMTFIYIVTAYKLGIESSDLMLVTMAITALSTDVLWDAHSAIGTFYNITPAKDERDRMRQTVKAVLWFNVITIIFTVLGFFGIALATERQPEIPLFIAGVTSLIIYSFAKIMKAKLTVTGGTTIVSIGVMAAYTVRVTATLFWKTPYACDYILVVCGLVYIAIYGTCLIKRRKLVVASGEELTSLES